MNRAVSWHNGRVVIPGVAYKDYDTEIAFQIYCADWLRKRYEVTGDSRFDRWHHSANERSNGREGFRAKLMGQSKGFPDFIHCGLKLAIEFKLKSRPVSVEQREWLRYFESIGWTARVVRDFERFRSVVQAAEPP